VHLGETALPAKCKSIKKKLDELGNSLASTGLTEARRTAYGEMIALFEQKEGKLGSGKSGKSSARKSTSELMKDMRSELDELDRLMLDLQESKPDFYNKHVSARVVIDSGGGHSGSDDETLPDSPAPPPVQ
jgi:hypothetical protein